MHESSHSFGCKNKTDKGQKVDNREFHLPAANTILIINDKRIACPFHYKLLSHRLISLMSHKKTVPTFPKKSEKSPQVHLRTKKMSIFVH